MLNGVGERGLLLRGMGRSYGDAAQNGGGLVVEMTRSVDDVAIDDATATAVVAAGVSLDDLMRVLLPRGYFVPVTPGTRFVTVGGAVASDIHGKNHHVDGSFGNHVLSLRLLVADGTVIDLGPDDELFWATVGGMGLTGIILDITVSLLSVTTSRIRVETMRLADLDAVLAAMSEGDHLHRYSVSWIDLVARGSRLGRGVLTWGDHAEPYELQSDRDPLVFDPVQLGAVPPVVPAPGFVNHLTARVFNELWYRKAPLHSTSIQTIAAYFHPLDAVADWNRLYGRAGFVQYQFLLPFGEEKALRTIITELGRHGASSPLVVLKRFGEGNRGYLSFPSPGWTLAVDIPAASPGLPELCRRLDRLVLDGGGRHYLAKDGHTSPAVIRAGYPRLEEWKAIRHSVDPHGVFQSDLARRLDLL